MQDFRVPLKRLFNSIRDETPWDREGSSDHRPPRYREPSMPGLVPTPARFIRQE